MQFHLPNSPLCARVRARASARASALAPALIYVYIYMCVCLCVCIRIWCLPSRASRLHSSSSRISSLTGRDSKSPCSTYLQIMGLINFRTTHKLHRPCVPSPIPRLTKHYSNLSVPIGKHGWARKGLITCQARQVTHSMPPEKKEMFRSLDDWAKSNVLVYLKEVDTCWQPQDLLPDPTSDAFLDEVRELRERAREIPDEYLVVLVGDMITEEALPTYQSMLNNYDGIADETGSSLTSWATWIRAWTAEENRHGDLLNKYLYLSGRVDMKAVEKTTQHLIGSGMVTY